VPESTALLRNEPVQARSTARLSTLLDAAAEVVDEIGYERMTTAMVAERAGASIGTVYRYFPDRIAVLQSLGARSLGHFLERVRPAMADKATWREAVDALFSVAVDSFTSEPGFHSLRFGDVIDVRPTDGDRSGNEIVAAEIADVLSTSYGLPSNADLRLRVEVALHIVDALLARAFAADPKGDKRFISEARTIGRDYLTGYYGDPTT
jgi:AcrR family transcriptional regulator